MARKRDYAKEYRDYHGKPEHIRERSMRNKARRSMGLGVGDPREVDHIVPISKGGTNDPGNLRVVSMEENRRKGARSPAETKGNANMGNLGKYRRAWGSHRDAVKAIRKERDEKVAKLERHRGSKYYDEQKQLADRKFAADLKAAQDRFGADIDAVLDAMRRRADEIAEEVTPPNEKQLAILEAVKMLDAMSLADYRLYMREMKGSSIGEKALYQLAEKRVGDGASVEAPRSLSDSAKDQIRELARGAKQLYRWDGSNRAEELKRWNDERLANVPVSIRSSTGASSVAEIDPTASDFMKQVIGFMAYDGEALAMLDRDGEALAMPEMDGDGDEAR